MWNNLDFKVVGDHGAALLNLKGVPFSVAVNDYVYVCLKNSSVTTLTLIGAGEYSEDQIKSIRENLMRIPNLTVTIGAP